MTVPCWKRLVRMCGIGSALALTVLVLPTAADMPDKFTNLKVLPRDITREQMTTTMRGFSAALGVRCDHCHARPEGKPDAEPDWASDAMPEKETARAMMRMTQDLNAKALANLPTKHADRVQVQCRTCHHGQPRPFLIEDILTKSYRAGGMDSVSTTYESLRTEYYGSDTYNFGDGMLPALGERIAGRDKPAEALAFAELNVKWYPESGYAYLARAQARGRAGDRAGALADLDKAVELDPQLKRNADWVKGQLDRK